MKKILAILMALMLVLVNVAALAELPDGNDNGEQGEQGEQQQQGETPAAGTTTDYTKGTEYTLTATARQTIVIPKVYTVTLPDDQVADKNLPSDTVEFTQSAKSVANSATVTTAPDLVSISTVNITETSNGGPNTDDEYTYDVEIVLPPFTGVGIYTYTLTETDQAVAGVTYIGDVVMKITVVQAGTGLQIAGIAVRKAEDADDTTAATKIDEFANEYKAGSLTVTKTVDGNMGDQSKEFPITVVFTAPTGKTVAGTISYSGDVTGSVAPSAWTDGTATVNFTLAHNETVQFDNIPEGVTYTVKEDDETKTNGIKHLTDDKADQADPNAYKVGGEVGTAATIATGDVTDVTITNVKNIDIDTGVSLDSGVYMLIMALALVGAAVLVLRRREEY